MNRTLFMQTAGTLCSVCGGANYRGECVLKCSRMVYEASRLRQYMRAYRNNYLTDTPNKIEYNLSRIEQYQNNLASRARKAFVVKYYAQGSEPSRLWIVGRVA